MGSDRSVLAAMTWSSFAVVTHKPTTEATDTSARGTSMTTASTRNCRRSERNRVTRPNSSS